jgi:hypothetical protein
MFFVGAWSKGPLRSLARIYNIPSLSMNTAYRVDSRGEGGALERSFSYLSKV